MGPKRRFVAYAMLAALLPSTGCTVIGVSLGSAIPRCPPPQTGPVDLAALPIGTDVDVAYVANPDPSSAASRLVRLEGVYRGTDWTRVFIESEEKSYGIPLSRLRETRTREGPRSYAVEGLFLGIGLDVTVVTLIWLSHQGWGSGGIE